MNNPAAPAILRRVTNSLKRKYFGRGAWGVVAAGALACGGGPKQAQEPKPQPTAPLPTAGLAGQRVALFPLTLVAAEDSLYWGALLADRRASLARADSVLEALITARAPEVTWVPPADVRAAARRSAGVASDPDQIGTAILRADRLVDVPDPLRSQLRTLVALAGGRNALIPAALVYRRKVVQPYGRMADRPDTTTAIRPDGHTAIAELSVVLVDVRMGKVVWRTVASGDGTDAWSALTAAVKALTPGLP